ncbi:hypothetical protein J2X36_004068 [Methylobacterium sp. BE186]|uniref:COG3904 family protein n=1 Tax=Methylobacterium sp. BE186 TaxID=2817715 RepID=UPI0028579155|nr:hypothetical protein [Methylobacterium sp. BE186]MDR7039294.1 hypothetical protein [Methylobacterium sp. BE186]
MRLGLVGGVFGQIFGQGFGRVFGKIFGRVFGQRRLSVPILGVLTVFGGGTACPAAAPPDLPEDVSPRIRALSVPRQALDGDDAGPQARLELGPDGRDLRLTGDLTEGVANRVAALLAAHPEVVRIHLTSDGGLVEEGLALGAIVAVYGLATYVPDVCASACTLVYVRGRGRYLAAGGRLGFHGPYEVGFFDSAHPVDAGPERTAYLNAGLTPEFVARALAVRSEDIWVPEAALLRAAGVVTEMVGPGSFREGPAAAPDRVAQRGGP